MQSSNQLEHNDSPDPELREAALPLLEFHLVRQRLARYTSFPPATELAQLLSPTYDSEEASRLQEETLEARRFLDGGLVIDLSEAKDLREAVGRAALGGMLSGEELRHLRDTLKSLRSARASLLRGKDMPILQSMAQDLPVLTDLEDELGASIGNSGEVLDSASPTLKELRAESRSAYQSLTESVERTMRRMERQKVLQEPIITQRNGRMVLLIKTEMKQRLAGIVHDVSDSGATLFIEPMALVEKGNRWRELALAEEREVERVLRALSAEVEDHSGDLLGGLELAAHLDLALAKARYAIAIKATPPAVIQAERQYVWLSEARHPLLGREAVPISVKIGDQSPVLLVTGPNAGGKTVALKTVGLLTLMAQAGLHVPAKEATLTVFDGVYVDIGDQQSIELSLSTFSSHIQNLRAVMEQATDRSLVLVDELGTSTEPEEGTALAKAILQYLCRRGTSLMATTHHREVSSFVQEQPGMMNASVELDPQTLAPTYRLTMGLPGRSYAIAIASRLGLAREIIDNAQALRPAAHRSAESLLKELQEERYLAEEARKQAEEVLAQANTRNSDLEEQLASIDDSRAELLEEARHQFQRRVDDISKRLRSAERALDAEPPRPSALVVEQETEPPLPEPALPEAVPAAPASEELKEEPEAAPSIREARKEVARIKRELTSHDWKPLPSRRSDWLKRLRSGDHVYMRGILRPVEVITPPDDGGTVEVLLGTMRALLPVHQIARPAPREPAPSQNAVYYSHSGSPKKPVDPELNLRGARVEDALDRIELWLDAVALAGLSSARISHGVGTGALRNAIREHLDHHPLVKSVGRDKNARTDGVTIVELV